MASRTTSWTAPFAAEAAALVERLQRSLVLVQSGFGHGSGVVWCTDGLIVTNHHVVGRGPVRVELADGRLLSGTLVARDRENDLAALRVPAAGLPAVPIGDLTRLRVGELVIAVGHPFGVRGTATLGIISATTGASWMGRHRRELLHADLDLAPGSSGGPLADTEGRVVGLASMVISPGIALAVPSHIVQRFAAGIGRRAAWSAF